MKLLKRLAYIMTIFIIAVLVFPNALPTAYKIRAEEMMKKGITYFNERHYIAAVDFFYKALENDPEYYAARIWLGKAFYYGGFTQNARAEWERNINLGADDLYLRQKLDTILLKATKPSTDNDETSTYLRLKDQTIKSEKGNNFHHPISLATHDDKLYVVGFKSNTVSIFSKNQKRLKVIDKGNITFNKPYDISFDKENCYWVSDYGQDRIHKFDSNDNYLLTIGNHGTDPGLFDGPKGITTDKDNNLYVTDSENNRIQKFDKNGKFLMFFGIDEFKKGIFSNPIDITYNPIDNNLYVLCNNSKSKKSYVNIFDNYGNYSMSFGEDKLVDAVSIKVNQNKLYFTDMTNGILSFDLKTEVWNTIQEINKEDPDSIGAPSDIAIDQTNVIYVAELYNNCVSSLYPEELLSSNLDVNIINTNVNVAGDSPIVTLTMYIKDKSGNFVNGLESANMVITENDQKQKHVFLEKASNKTRKMAVTVANFLNDKIDNHGSQMKAIMKRMLSNFGTLDQLEIVSFNKGKEFISQPFTNSELSPISNLLSNQIPKLDNKFFGGIIYKAVSDVLLQDDSKGSVIIFSDDSLSEDDLFPLGLDVYIDYAKNNDISIHVFSFNQKEENPTIAQLKKLAEETNGKFIDAYKDDNAFNITTILRDKPDNFYKLRYTSSIPAIGKKIEKFRKIQIELNLNGMIGIDKTEYYILTKGGAI